MDAAAVNAAHAWVTSQPFFAALLTLIAQVGIFVLPLALVVAWLSAGGAYERARSAIAAGLVAAAVAFVVGYILEHVLGRTRPFLELGFTPLFPHVADSSFPSDHTLVGVALVGPLLWHRPRIGGWLFAWTLVIGLARVAAGVHYPSDIIGSIGLAAVIDAGVWLAVRPVVARFDWRRWDAGLLGTRLAERRQ